MNDKAPKPPEKPGVVSVQIPLNAVVDYNRIEAWETEFLSRLEAKQEELFQQGMIAFEQTMNARIQHLLSSPELNDRAKELISSLINPANAAQAMMSLLGQMNPSQVAASQPSAHPPVMAAPLPPQAVPPVSPPTAPPPISSPAGGFVVQGPPISGPQPQAVIHGPSRPVPEPGGRVASPEGELTLSPPMDGFDDLDLSDFDPVEEFSGEGAPLEFDTIEEISPVTEADGEDFMDGQVMEALRRYGSAYPAGRATALIAEITNMDRKEIRMSLQRLMASSSLDHTKVNNVDYIQHPELPISIDKSVAALLQNKKVGQPKKPRRRKTR